MKKLLCLLINVVTLFICGAVCVSADPTEITGYDYHMSSYGCFDYFDSIGSFSFTYYTFEHYFNNYTVTKYPVKDTFRYAVCPQGDYILKVNKWSYHNS